MLVVDVDTYAGSRSLDMSWLLVDGEYDDEDDESEDEDVFAFGPPGTADPEAHANTATLPPLASPTVSYPPPTFDPSSPSPYSTYNMAGPSSLHSRHPYPMSPQVETPPSTDSQSGDDPYRMRRIGQTISTPATTHTGRSAVSSAVSSREVHVSLPRTKERIIEEEAGEDPQKVRPPSSATSFPSLDSAAASIKYASSLHFLTWY